MCKGIVARMKSIDDTEHCISVSLTDGDLSKEWVGSRVRCVELGGSRNPIARFLFMRHPASTIFNPPGCVLTHSSFALSFKSTDVPNPYDLASTRTESVGVLYLTFKF